jgi:hypothetical protein
MRYTDDSPVLIGETASSNARTKIEYIIICFQLNGVYFYLYTRNTPCFWGIRIAAILQLLFLVHAMLFPIYISTFRSGAWTSVVVTALRY